MTSAAWPGTLTLRQMRATRPRASTSTVLRSMPMYVLPYIDFSTHAPYASVTPPGSEASGNVRPYFPANRSMGAIASLDTPITSTPMPPRSGNASWNACASTVQPGVSALG